MDSILLEKRPHSRVLVHMIDYSICTYTNLKGCDLRSKSSNIQKQKIKIKKKKKSKYLHK